MARSGTLFAEGNDTWFLEMADIQFTITRDSEGEAVGLSMRQGEMTTRLDRQT